MGPRTERVGSRAAAVQAWVAAAWVKRRTSVLSVSGFALVTAAGWDISRPLGFLVGGVSCLIIELLGRGEQHK